WTPSLPARGGPQPTVVPPLAAVAGSERRSQPESYEAWVKVECRIVLGQLVERCPVRTAGRGCGKVGLAVGGRQPPRRIAGARGLVDLNGIARIQQVEHGRVGLDAGCAQLECATGLEIDTLGPGSVTRVEGGDRPRSRDQNTDLVVHDRGCVGSATGAVEDHVQVAVL